MAVVHGDIQGLVDSITAESDAPPRANPNKLELATGARVFRQWFYRTGHDLGEVDGTGYWDSIWEHGLKVGDLVEVLASDGAPETERACYEVLADKVRPQDGIHIEMRRIR